MSLYLPRGMALTSVEDTLDKMLPPVDMPPDIDELIHRSETGAAIFWGEQRRCVLLPPFPLKERYVTDGYDVGPLCTLLDHDLLVALILIRLGAYSIGVCRGEQLIDSKTGTGPVHARHKKGGSSQGRFARHREKQIEYFLTRVCTHAREHIEPHARSVDYLVYGGARGTILLLRKQCPFLEQFDDRVLRMLLDIPDPRKAVLESAVSRIWSTTVVEWYESDA